MAGKSPLKSYIPSALNYTGGKFKLLPQLAPLFPQVPNTFFDVFTGGGVVAVNARSITGAEKVVANDLEAHVMAFFEFLSKETDIDRLVKEIKGEISALGLSSTTDKGYAFYGADSSKGLGSVNKAAHAKLKKLYNDEASGTRRKQILFYLLIVFSFNNQIRFNDKGEYNLPVGKRDFNASMEKKLRAFAAGLAGDIAFMREDFRKVVAMAGEGDFLYCDPPYLITLAGYNEKGGWGEQDDEDLMDLLDSAAGRGAKFAMSNVVEHKGMRNDKLVEWARKWNRHDLEFDYNNSNYRSRAKQSSTCEVLITSY